MRSAPADRPVGTAPRETVPPDTAVIGVDAALVVLFAALGSRTHSGELTLGAVASTAWPFLLALLLAHLVLGLRRRPGTGLLGGVTVWLTTVAGGMVVRQLVGDGTALAFVAVATAFNAATLLGWRLLAWGVARLVRRGETERRRRR